MSDDAEIPQVAQRPWIVFLLAMPIAGAAAGFAFNSTRGVLEPELRSGSPTEQQMIEGMDLRKSISRKGSALGCASAAGIIVAAFGLVMGAQTRIVHRALMGLAAGAILGGTVGGISGYITQELSEYAVSNSVSTTQASFMISGAFWIPLGAACAFIAAFVGSRMEPLSDRLTGPIVGGIVASAATPILANIVFPIDYKGRIPPYEDPESYFVGVVGAILLAIGVAVGRSRTRHP